MCFSARLLFFFCLNTVGSVLLQFPCCWHLFTTTWTSIRPEEHAVSSESLLSSPQRGCSPRQSLDYLAASKRFRKHNTVLRSTKNYQNTPILSTRHQFRQKKKEKIFLKKKSVTVLHQTPSKSKSKPKKQKFLDPQKRPQTAPVIHFTLRASAVRTDGGREIVGYGSVKQRSTWRIIESKSKRENKNIRPRAKKINLLCYFLQI